jgi:O-antigen ligase
LNGGPLVSSRGAVLLACLLAATVLPRGRGACLGAAIYGATLAIAGGVLAVFRYDVAFVVPCQGACGGLGFTGVLPNEDLLGIALAASIPFTFLGFRGAARYWLMLYLALMVVATGSQTATAAAVIAAVALLVVRPGLDGDRATPVRTALAWLSLAGAVVASVALIERHWSSTALSGRPALWEVAFHHIGQAPWFGHGAESWARLSETGQIPLAAQRSAHNQWLDVLFAAGWVGAALLVSTGIAMVWSAGRARPGVLVALATIAIIGTAEGAWSIGTYDGLSFSLVALILAGLPEHGAPARAVARVRAARAGRRAMIEPAGEPIALRLATGNGLRHRP